MKTRAWVYGLVLTLFFGAGWASGQETIYVSQDGYCGGYTPCYSTIQEGIDAASLPSVIKITQETYYEDIVLDINQIIDFDGGWDTGFTTCSSETTISGSIRITDGKTLIGGTGKIIVSTIPPTVSSFSANPTTINFGESSTLSWSLKNAASALIDQGVGSVNPSGGSVDVSPATTTTYTLTASNPMGTGTAQATVTVIPNLPTINSFLVNPDTIESGQSSTLSWSITNATSALIDQGIGSVDAASGSTSVSPSTTTTYTLTATNAGGYVTAQVTLTVNAVGPPAIVSFTVNPGTISPEESSTLSWSITNATSASIDMGVGSVNSVAGSTSVSPPSNTTYTLTANNGMGPSTAQVTVIVSGTLPPDPSIVAPALDRTVSTDIKTATSFLYSGYPPIQTGVAPGVIEPKRTAVLRGRVLDKNNDSLPGVTITVLNHPEYGQTLSRADGMFDLVVNGGGPLNVNYRKNGYLPAQRQCIPAWEEYFHIDDVVLITQDTRLNTIDLTDTTQPFYVAQGSVVTDEDGTRQATLLIPQGTQAQVYNQDGTTRPVTTLNLRLTEYTVGSNGPAAMPALLPSASAYTYALELKTEEGVFKLNGKDVLFDRPVPFYVNDFLGFPVGSAVPVGYYDSDKGAWVASENGRVIKILAINSGSAELDTDGDGLADDAAKLEALGITAQELIQLASLYTAGVTLWRVQMNHLSTYDCNWPYGPPGDAGYPDQPGPGEPGRGPDDPCEERGSVIECQSQVLGESLRVAGTSYRLHYRSNRIPGFAAGRTLRIPLSGTSTPSSLLGIRLIVGVAGQHFSALFSAAPSQVYPFVWDGLDGMGRRVSGWHKVTVQIGYVYQVVYYPVREDLDRAFGRLAGRGAMTIAGRTETSLVTLWQRWTGELSAGLPDQGLGGWSLTPHHIYDPVGSVLHRGDGQRLTGQESLAVVTSIAVGGTGTCPDYGDPCGDGGQATEARVGFVNDMAFSADGTLFIAEWYRIRKVDPEGIITTIAGTGEQCKYQTESLCGDGGPASLAQTIPRSLAVGPDGSLYILEYFDGIRRIRPDGVIEKVAGKNPAELRSGIDNPWDGDGGPAADAFLIDSWDLAFGPNGGLYVSQWKYHCVRQIGTDGYIATVAGKCGSRGFSGDGGPGVQALLYGPHELSAGPYGSLYIADAYNHRVRRLWPDGTIETVAGSGPGAPTGDGGLAVEAKIGYPYRLAVDREGSLYIPGSTGIRRVGSDGIIQHLAGVEGGYCNIPGQDADLAACGIGQPAAVADFWLEDRNVAAGPDGLYAEATFDLNYVSIPVILRFSRALPGISQNSALLASQDRREIYLFDAAGRHLKTIDAYPGTDRYRFSYDARGLLSSLADRDGNVTTFERDTSGKLTAIVGPYGHRTAVTLNANGYLDSLTDPAGGRASMVYDRDGLLLTFTDANGNIHRFDYNEMGLLTQDEDAAGGTSTLTRTEGDRWSEVALRSPTARVTTYRVETLTTGDTLLLNRFPDGSETRVTQHADGTRETLLPDGSSVTTVQRGDPRFGMGSPVITSARVATPSGLTAQVFVTYTADLADPANVMSFTSLVEDVTLNGRTYHQVFDPVSRLVTLTTPEGRVGGMGLDASGRIVELHWPGITPVGFGYDGQGRLNRAQQGNDRQYLITYNAQGRVQSVTDPLGRVEQFSFNEANRPTALVSPAGKETGFEADPVGNLTGLTPPGQPAHDFSYTQNNLLARYDPPSLGFGASTTLVYDGDGRVEQIARAGQVVMVDYDTAGRVQSLTLPEGGGTYAYEYGAVTRRLARATAPGGQILDLTNDGFLLSSESWSGPVSGSVSRTYDADFRLASQTVTGEDGVAFGYDQDGMLTSAGGLSIQRDPVSGLVIGTTLGALTKTYGYDTFGDLTSCTVASGGSTLYTAQYTRDASSRITEKIEDTGGSVRTFRYTYDIEGRLAAVEIDGSPVEAYTYDPNGNRLTATGPGGTQSSTYDVQDRLLSFGTASYGYTQSGDLLTRTIGAETTTYRYDELGNLLGVTLSDGREIGYIVDGRGRRVGKTVGGSLVQGLLYRNLLRPVAELDGTGAVVSQFVYGTRDNLPEYMVRGGRTYLFVADPLGSPRFVVDTETGAIAQRLEFDAFGNVLEDSNPGFQPFGFAGGLYDPDTGLVRFGRRDYDAEVGRWTARDPALFAGGSANLYEYVLGDPVNLTDPTGLNLEGFLVESPWLVGFTDGLTHIPFTHTSVSELLREGLGMNDLIDRCSLLYRAGHSIGESAGLVIAGIGMLRTIAKMGALPAEAIFGHFGWGMASARDVWSAVSGIQGGARVGGRFGQEVGQRVGERLVEE
jgi:RHS repeat-associated protein